MGQKQSMRTTDPSDLDRMDVTKDFLKTSTSLQLEGLKVLLKKELTNPMIPAAAQGHARAAYDIAGDLLIDEEWRRQRLEEWLEGYEFEVSLENPAYAVPTGGKKGRKVRIPPFLRREPLNLKLDLAKHLAEIGTIATNQVYEDMIAQKNPKRMIHASLQPSNQEDSDDEDKH